MTRNSLPYRKSAIAVIVNKENKILLIQKKNYQDDQWDFPGGGIEKNETEEQAILRELHEEIGTDKFEIVAKSAETDQYEWPDEIIEKYLREKGQEWRGQQRTQFLVKFLGEQTDINLQKDELKQIMWVNATDISKYLVFPNQSIKAKELLEEFKL